jgi:hypothetical protein
MVTVFLFSLSFSLCLSLSLCVSHILKFAILGFELRVSHFIGRHSTIRAMPLDQAAVFLN